MVVVPFVCAEFHDPSGKVIHRIRAHELRNIVTVPDAIMQDPLFAMMVEDGSLKAPENKLELKALENDPDAEVGKVGKPAKAAKTAKGVKAVSTETALKTEAAGRTEKTEAGMKNEKTEKAEKTETAMSTEKGEKAVKTDTAMKTERTGKAEKLAMEPDKPEDTPAAADVKTDAGQDNAK